MRRATIADIAVAFAISESPLMKCVHFLGKEGLVETTLADLVRNRAALAKVLFPATGVY